MTTRRKAATDTVPREIAFALQYGKTAWQLHPGYAEANDEATAVFLACGRLINSPDHGRYLWQRYRGELMKRPGIKTWWAYGEFEKCQN